MILILEMSFISLNRQEIPGNFKMNLRMTKNTSFHLARRPMIPLIISAHLAFLVASHSMNAQTPTEQHVVVSGEEISSTQVPSAYGASSAFSQSRFAPLTNAYVLPAGEIYTSVIFEDDVVHYRSPDYHWTEECEMGLPYRINLALETDIQHHDGDSQVSTFSLEGRYALADWDKIPLNPTFFTECKFGIGHILVDEGAPTPSQKFGPHGFDTSDTLPDSVEMRLLLSEDFFDRIEWAMNTFFEQEIGGDRGREWGIANSIVTPITLFGSRPASPAPIPQDKNVQSKNPPPVAGASNLSEALKAGIEFQFRSFSDVESRGTPYKSFVIGPTASWKPNRAMRFDVSPLFGVNHKSPEMQLFCVFSYLFGGGGGPEAGGEAPVSTRNR